MGKKNKGGRIGPLTLEVKSESVTPKSLSASNSTTSLQIAHRTASLENVSIDLDNESPVEKLMLKASDEVRKHCLTIFLRSLN